MVANGKLYTKVKERLSFKPNLDDSNITVAIMGNHDVVVLGGIVNSFAEKILAENTVKSIEGVKAIANEIKVDPSMKYKKTDAEIAVEALSAIKSNVWIPSEKIKLVVKDGIMTLSGEVAWQYEKSAAFAAVKNLWGIKSVINNIIVKPSVNINEGGVKQEITKEFERHARLDASNIQIKVDGTKITLSGEVTSFDEMDIAEDTAWSIAGVTQVKNELILK